MKIKESRVIYSKISNLILLLVLLLLSSLNLCNATEEFLGTDLLNTSKDSDAKIKSNNFSNTQLEIRNLRARPTIGQNKNTAIYCEIINKSHTDDLVLKSASADEISSKVELHDSFLDENGIARMRTIDTMVIPCNSAIDLKPGGSHIMVFNLKEKLIPGRYFLVKLKFSNDITISLKCLVMEMKQPNATKT